jgi:hypothetical protein
MDGKDAAVTHGEVEHAQDLHRPAVEILRQVRARGREVRLGRVPVEHQRQRPRLTIEERDGRSVDDALDMRLHQFRLHFKAWHQQEAAARADDKT